MLEARDSELLTAGCDVRPGHEPGRVVVAALAGALLAGSITGPFGERAMPPAPNPLVIQLATDRVTYPPGDTAVATLTATNRSDSTVVLGFRSGQRYDFELRDANDALIWRWSEGRGFIQMLGSETISPDGRLVYEERIPLPRQPGDYQLSGIITSAVSGETDTVVLHVDRPR